MSGLNSMQRLRELFGGLGNTLFQQSFLYALWRRGMTPDLYLQDFTVFDEFREELRVKYGQGIVRSDYVSLHVRRGDYINNSVYVDLTKTDYFERAIAMFPGEKFLVFCADRQPGSDDDGDLLWCKERFKGDNFIFATGNDEITDFNLMAGCKAHIIPNSTFSWWAAYVGGGETIAPKEWFTDKIERVKYPTEWKII